MTRPFDVCVRGAGIVGGTLALVLARQGLRVALIGRTAMAADATARTDNHADVRAYALNAASRALLQDLRVWPYSSACAVSAMRVLGDSNGQTNFEATALGVPALAWIVDVPALEQALIQALRFQPGVELLSQAVSAPLTVVCEGRASSTRAEFGVAFEQFPYHQHALAARVRATQAHQGRAWQWFSPGQTLALLPLPDGLGDVTPAQDPSHQAGAGALEASDGNLLALVWSVSHERANELMALTPLAFEQALSAASDAGLGDLHLCSERLTWPLQRARAQSLCGPGWVLAGDAAHTVHPLAGQGLNLGLADVRELAQVLAGREYWRGLGDLRLLRRYERARRAGLAVMDGAIDGLQWLFGEQAPPVVALRNLGLRAFNASGPLKRWAARQAMGNAAPIAAPVAAAGVSSAPARAT